VILAAKGTSTKSQREGNHPPLLGWPGGTSVAQGGKLEGDKLGKVPIKGKRKCFPSDQGRGGWRTPPIGEKKKNSICGQGGEEGSSTGLPNGKYSAERKEKRRQDHGEDSRNNILFLEKRRANRRDASRWKSFAKRGKRERRRDTVHLQRLEGD